MPILIFTKDQYADLYWSQLTKTIFFCCDVDNSNNNIYVYIYTGSAIYAYLFHS